MDTNENNNPNDPTPPFVPPPAPIPPVTPPPPPAAALPPEPAVPPVGVPPVGVPPPAPAIPAGEFSKDEKMWGMLSHLTALIGFLVIPFGNIVAPLVIWLIKKDTMPFVDDQAKESLNFQITLTIAMIVAVISIVACVGYILAPAVYITGIIFVIMASLKANDGIKYRYPFALRLIK